MSQNNVSAEKERQPLIRLPLCYPKRLRLLLRSSIHMHCIPQERGHAGAALVVISGEALILGIHLGYACMGFLGVRIPIEAEPLAVQISGLCASSLAESPSSIACSRDANISASSC